jgi:predicted transcriptional regulator
MLSALANPHRLRIVAALARERSYVSQLARQMNMSRPLLHMHLRKLEASGLIAGTMEISDDGKAMKYYEVTDFAVSLTPGLIIQAAETLTADGPESPGKEDS